MREELSVDREVLLLVAPVLLAHGYELVLCEFLPRPHVLRLFIDLEHDLEGGREGGVSVDDCAKVSRLVGDILDAEGISERISGRYHLEVSSPGLDRPLVKPADFKRFIGRQVKVKTREPLLGRKNFCGELQNGDEREIQVAIDGQLFTIALEHILRANLVPEF